MRRLKIVVLRGGPSSEFEVSLKTGKKIMDLLYDEHQIFDIILDRKGDWYHNGIRIDPKKLAPQVDFIFNAHSPNKPTIKFDLSTGEAARIMNGMSLNPNAPRDEERVIERSPLTGVERETLRRFARQEARKQIKKEET